MCLNEYGAINLGSMGELIIEGNSKSLGDDTTTSPRSSRYMWHRSVGDHFSQMNSHLLFVRTRSLISERISSSAKWTLKQSANLSSICSFVTSL
jgi:hypothetical protein